MIETIKTHLQICLERVVSHDPFVPSITNQVIMNMVANAQIVVGGSPAMLHLADEGENLAQMA